MSDERNAGTITGNRTAAQIRDMRVAVLAALMFVAPVIAVGVPVSHKEVRVARIDRFAVENLQRWVNVGHDDWCKDAREVASMELRRVAPEFSGNRLDLVSLPASASTRSAMQATFTWTSIDGSASYRITVERYEWLKPVAGKLSNEVWTPSRIEITRSEEPAPARHISRELPKA
jgi:hypothetical protein